MEIEMSDSGIVRKLDELGRIVIPKEIRDKFELKEGSEIEIYTKGDKVVLRKYKDTYCPICLTRCEHTDNYCKHCGKKFSEFIQGK